ncbi:hypothetical protein YA0089_13995 [Pseudomonas viridiflava]|uniref:hypothetical protein n=1 Tax=Pseudomonas viridiflava TaxID=33069 RepID=UPI0018E656C2|nr:hypothetical protein [Pseudomonas viridiflava]MBI6724730.1 hypothetical protein [Pseudomonas viridiflava]
MKYRPRRATARWMEGAPDYVLSCHDAGDKTADRYTVYFGGPKHWDESMGRTVHYLGLSYNPSSPTGVSMWGEGDAASRDASSGKKIRWLDLPENVRKHVQARATE